MTRPVPIISMLIDIGVPSSSTVYPACLVITGRAALILVGGKGFQPLSDIDTIERRFHVGGDRCVRARWLPADGVAHVLLLSLIRRLTPPSMAGAAVRCGQ